MSSKITTQTVPYNLLIISYNFLCLFFDLTFKKSYFCVTLTQFFLYAKEMQATSNLIL